MHLHHLDKRTNEHYLYPMKNTDTLTPFPGPWTQSGADPLKIVSPMPAGSHELWRKRTVATVHQYIGNSGVANAEIIVRAVNAHEDLVQAAKRLVQTFAVHACDSNSDCTLCAALDAGEAAIAKAEGK